MFPVLLNDDFYTYLRHVDLNERYANHYELRA
jgi:hypothetical protein